MRDIATELIAWMDAGEPFALASVVGVSGSAPRPMGSALAVDGRGAAVGGVSGGCVEAAVYVRCQEVLETGRAVLESFGYSDDDAFAVGLTCGGEIEVLVVRVEPEDHPIRTVLEAVAAKRPARLLRAVEGPDIGAALAITEHGRTGDLNTDDLDPGRARARTGDSAERGTTGGPETPGPDFLLLPRESARIGRFALEVYEPPPRLLVFGAVDFAASVVTAAKFCGFDVTVCDARPVFATPIRFPDADDVVVDWPHRYLERTPVDERTAICVLTHDAKFDIPLLELALESKAAYIGAMGSRRTHADRLERLRAAGVGETALARLRSPIGLDLGGRDAAETAMSIVGEIIALRNGAGAGFLTSSDGPIHH